MPNGPSEYRPPDLHDNILVFDAHTDSLQRAVVDGVDLGRRSPKDPLVERSDLPRFRDGGVDAQIFAVWIDTLYVPDHAIRRAIQLIEAFHRLLETHPDQVALASTAADVRSAAGAGKLAALLSLEGGDAIENDLDALRIYHRLGASSMTLCHSRTTDWVDSSTDEPKWNGLNDFGRSVIREMNRLGMVVDVSHVSDRAVLDVMDASEHPIVASHSSCKALTNHPRNLGDPLLEAIASTGGVVGINFYSGFLSQAYLDEFRSRYADVLSTLNRPPDVDAKERDRVAGERLYAMSEHDVPRPPFDVILDHIDHAVSVAGVDHVGIGADLDVPYLSTPLGFDDVTAFPAVTRGLLERGYGEENVRKIMGENWLRVFAEVTGA